MEQLLYNSIARADLGGDDVFKIVEVSALRNPEREVTGFLIYRKGCFLQVIEGAPEALDQLLEDLARDPRHHSIKVLAREPIAARTFPDWRMKRVIGGQDEPALGDVLARLERAGGMAIASEVMKFWGFQPA